MPKQRHRWFLAFGLLTCGIVGLAQQTQRGSASAAIRGRVQIADRLATPVRRARMTLIAAGRTFTTYTDTDGKYQFENLAAGTYQVNVSKAGFLPETSRAGRPVDPAVSVNVAAGQVSTTDFSMQRAAALVGRVIDEDGTALAGVEVTATRFVEARAGARQSEEHLVRTDDLGRFRVHTLPPGNYYLDARPYEPWPRERVYYPASPAIEQAQAIAIAAGQELDSLDVTVSRPPAPNPVVEDGGNTSTRQAQPAPDATRISGHVTQANAKPLAAALVALTPNGRQGGINTRSDALGRFEFIGMPAGQYILTATAAGFVSPDAAINRPAGGKIIDVKERQRIDNADVVLVRPGAIEGRVLDEFGDPVPGVKVQFGQLLSGGARTFLLPNPDPRSAAATDDVGSFRGTGLFPGDYYVFVLTGPFERSGPSPFSSVDFGVTGFAPTYFPGTTKAGLARAVHVDAGRDARDVTFALSPARMAVVSGNVGNAAGQPAANARVVLLQMQAGDVRAVIAAATMSAADGSFTYRNIPPGSYVVQVSAAQPSGPDEFGSALLMVPEVDDGRGETRVSVSMRPPATARGRITFEGSAPPPPKDQLHVQFMPTDFISGPVGVAGIQSHIDDSWNFDVGPLAWIGLIRVPTPAGWVLKHVMVNGRDVADTPYDFRASDVNAIEIVLTSRAASVRGVVLNGNDPAANCTVIVFSADSTKWESPSRFVFGARSDPQGAFVVSQLLPGRYLAVALSSPAGELTPARFAALRAVATPFLVSEGETATLTLKLR